MAAVTARLAAVLRLAGETARAMVGVSSYRSYLEHMAASHPDAVPMTEVEFFDNRNRAQYGEGGSGITRCC